MRKNHPLLKQVYILTDADDSFTEEMRMWLSSEGWDKVWVGKRDLYPDWDDRELGVAVDMEIARRAGVFVGNGVSPSQAKNHREELISSSRRPHRISYFLDRMIWYILI